VLVYRQQIQIIADEPDTYGKGKKEGKTTATNNNRKSEQISTMKRTTVTDARLKLTRDRNSGHWPTTNLTLI